MCAQSPNLLVFRDGRQFADGRDLQSALRQRLRSLQPVCHSDAVLTAFLQAAELECALADSGKDTTQLETVTNCLAAALVESSALPDLGRLSGLLDETAIPPRLAISAPEGFAFYGLHPLAFADVIQDLGDLPPRIVVVGIRSIGTALSAVTAAALRRRGIQAVRTTVRPVGHPYNRRTEFSAEAAQFVTREISRSGMFLVVDEGPGLSGSSFLSAAEALVRTGAPKEKIRLICAHAPDVDRLCAENAASRWRQFHSIVVPSQARRPADAQVWIGGGEWRRYVVCDKGEWPASWLSFERPKYLSAQGEESRFYKFSGYGCYGEPACRRESEIAGAGFGPPVRRESDGYVSFPLVNGRTMSAGDLSESVAARLANYCAFRGHVFAAETADLAPLQQMVAHNLRELKLDIAADLRLERAVVPDGRMQPHEWLLTGSGQMLKTDSGSHGDDHFFPAATDIAWDLAGAIAEWRMNAAQRETFLEMYRRASGDNARSRIDDYITAYAVFRCAYSTMAANAMQGTDEQARLERSAACYQALLACLDRRERPLCAQKRVAASVLIVRS